MAVICSLGRLSMADRVGAGEGTCMPPRLMAVQNQEPGESRFVGMNKGVRGMS